MNIELNDREVHMILEAISLEIASIDVLISNTSLETTLSLLKANKEGYNRLRIKILEQSK